jgi:hypothetical protein
VDHSTPQLHPPDEICWRVTSAIGHLFVCELYDSGEQVEVRVLVGELSLLYSQRVATVGEARALSHRWLRTIVANGSFTLLSPQ